MTANKNNMALLIAAAMLTYVSTIAAVGCQSGGKDMRAGASGAPASDTSHQLVGATLAVAHLAGTQETQKQSAQTENAELEAKAEAFASASAELEQEAKRWLKSFDIDDMGHVTGNAYKPSDGKYFSFEEHKKKSASEGTVSKYDSYKWTATSKIKIGGCPAKSVWNVGVSVDCDWSAFSYGTVEQDCRFITPEVVRMPEKYFKR
jgi:hypothetical protein